MSSAKQNEYFKSKVLTASAPQLHLMLIEGAVRFCRQAEQQLEANNEGHANEAMLRALDIISEMLAGVRHSESDINTKLADLYQFLFYTLTSAYVNTDRQKLADVVRILEFERETWLQAVQKIAVDTPEKQAPTPHIGSDHVGSGPAAESFSFEA